MELAQSIVRDAEGATKFVTVETCGAASSSDALKAGYAVANSPLVKTALFASDPNWGRIAGALGNAHIDGMDSNEVRIWLGPHLVYERGGRAVSYTEEQGAEVFALDDIHIRIDLAMGQVTEHVWASDLSHEYVSVNADYRS